MRKPASITFDHESITVDGVRLALDLIPQILYELTHPDARKWYRLSRIGDSIQVEVRITENANGSIIASTGNARSSSEGVREQGQEIKSA
jgi:hypothetical protein